MKLSREVKKIKAQEKRDIWKNQILSHIVDLVNKKATPSKIHTDTDLYVARLIKENPTDAHLIRQAYFQLNRDIISGAN